MCLHYLRGPFLQAKRFVDRGTLRPEQCKRMKQSGKSRAKTTILLLICTGMEALTRKPGSERGSELVKTELLAMHGHGIPRNSPSRTLLTHRSQHTCRHCFVCSCFSAAGAFRPAADFSCVVWCILCHKEQSCTAISSTALPTQKNLIITASNAAFADNHVQFKIYTGPWPDLFISVVSHDLLARCNPLSIAHLLRQAQLARQS
jgi:hypothetical protein